MIAFDMTAQFGTGVAGERHNVTPLVLPRRHRGDADVSMRDGEIGRTLERALEDWSAERSRGQLRRALVRLLGALDG